MDELGEAVLTEANSEQNETASTGSVSRLVITISKYLSRIAECASTHVFMRGARSCTSCDCVLPRDVCRWVTPSFFPVQRVRARGARHEF